MADHHSHTQGHPDMDYAEHERTFDLFLTMTKWSTIFVIGVVIFMAITLL
jgi:Bacterial aa3 type cytochrome c oxidase subunit IV